MELLYLTLALVVAFCAGMSWQWRRNQARIEALEDDVYCLEEENDVLVDMVKDDDYDYEDDWDNQDEFDVDEALSR